MEQLTFVKNVTWQDVWNAWREREEEIWRPHYEELGLTWETWRAKYIEPFSLDKRDWKEFRMERPEEFVPMMWIGGFKGWKRYLSDPNVPTRFSDMVTHPELPNNQKVQEILHDFPKPTTIIAAKFGDEYVLGEGMHRCSAIALAARAGRQVAGEVFVHLFEFTLSEKELFETARTGMPTHDA